MHWIDKTHTIMAKNFQSHFKLLLCILQMLFLIISRDFEELASPELSVVQYKQVILQAVKSLFGIVSTTCDLPDPCLGYCHEGQPNHPNIFFNKMLVSAS